jgi:hypothetical protein
VPRDVDVQDLTTGVLDHEEAVQQLKLDRRNGEEVEGDNCFSMILQKRQPTFPRITPSSNTSQKRATLRSETTKPSFCSSP